MRLLHCSDLHVGLRRYGIDYGDLALGRLLDAVEEHQPDLVTLGGDTFNVRRPAPSDIAAVIATVSAVLRMGIPVAIAEGNHDGSTTVIDDRSSSLAWMNMLPWDAHAFPRGVSTALVRTGAGDVAIASFPFPHHTGDDPADAIADGAGDLDIRYPGAAARLYLGHLSVTGALNGSEQSLYLGNDWKVNPYVFEEYDVALLGHIHHRQHHGKAWYPGSPERIDFSEGTQRKGFLMLDLVGSEWVAEVVDTYPAPMVSVRLPEDDLLEQDFEGAVTRLTLPGGVFSAAEQAEFVRTIRRGGARYVKVVVEPVARKRSTILVEAVGPTEQLRRWLLSTDQPLEPAMTLASEVMEATA